MACFKVFSHFFKKLKYHSREFAQEFVNSQNLDMLELILSYRYTFVPDENIVQTVLETGRFKQRRMRYNLRYIDWRRPSLRVTRYFE
jgi:hypothetical protein